MRRHLAKLLLVAAGLVSTPATVSCTADAPRADGAACSRDADCESGLCYPGRCLAPDGDDDHDGLSNAQERDLRSDPARADSDGDGATDGAEVGGSVASPRDSDGDGVPDVLESAVADADLDCLSDQLDPDDDHRESDLAVVARAVCRTRGVCGAEGLVTAVCLQLAVDGVLTSQAVCDYSQVPGFDGNVEVRCDDLDNDCDGRTDEDVGYLEGGETLRALGEPCAGTGACAARSGLVECGPGERAICSVNHEGSAFAGATSDLECDAVDNDCDGQTDEGVTWTNPRTGGVRLFGQPCVARGVCGLASGVVECAPGTSDGICSTEPGASDDRSAAEVCDGADNDCDGLTDEELRLELGGGVQLPLGSACGTGACDGGQVVCGSAGKPVCSTANVASAGVERCDGVDEDCDGETDEPDGLILGCPTVGACADLTLVGARCVDGDASGDESAGVTRELLCEFDPPGHYTAGDEAACDGLDDDCDGETDEGFVTAGGAALGADCVGQGACYGATGTVVCATDLAEHPHGAVCSADLAGTPETCDGADEDCDGLTDEPASLPGGGVCATAGVCGAAAVPPACVGGGWVCAYEQDDDWQPVESRCDALDNDCDGRVDEGLPRAPSGAIDRWHGAQPPSRERWPVAAGDGAVWLFGGLAVSGDGGADVLADLWRYDVTTRTWARIVAPQAPPPRAGHAVAWVAGAGVLVVHGGFGQPGVGEGPWLADGSPDKGMWVFDPATGAWTPVAQDLGDVPPTALARRRHAVAAVGAEEILLVGGFGAGELTTDGSFGVTVALRGQLSAEATSAGQIAWRCSWEVVDGPPWRAGATLVADPATGAAALLGGLGSGAIQVGGLGGAAPWGYHRATADGPWAEVAGPAAAGPLGVTPAAAIVGDGLVVAGAESWRTDAPGAPWTPLSGAPSAPSGPVFAGADGGVRLLVADATDAPRRRTLSLAPGETAWTVEGRWTGPEPRTGAAVVVDPSTGVVRMIGGATASAVALAEAWRLAPGATTWTAELAPGSANASLAVNGARGVWDGAAGRAVLVGGVKEGAGDVAALTLYTPGQGLASVASTATSWPPRFERASLALDPDGQRAWLATLDPSGGIAMWNLALDTLSWSRVDVDPTATGAAPAVGAGPFALGFAVEAPRLAIADGTGVAVWSLAPSGPSWVGPVRIELAPSFGRAATALWDAEQGAAVFVAPSASGAARIVRVDPIAPAHVSVPLAAPGAPADAGWAFDPQRGLVAFGGRAGASVVATTWLYPLSCLAP